VITSKAANGYHFKTGQWKVPEINCCTLPPPGQASSDHGRSRCSGSVLRSFFCAEAHDDLQQFFGSGQWQLAHPEIVEDEQGSGHQEKRQYSRFFRDLPPSQ